MLFQEIKIKTILIAAIRKTAVRPWHVRVYPIRYGSKVVREIL